MTITTVNDMLDASFSHIVILPCMSYRHNGQEKPEVESGVLKGKGVDLIVLDDKVVSSSKAGDDDDKEGAAVVNVAEALFKCSDGSAR